MSVVVQSLADRDAPLDVIFWPVMVRWLTIQVESNGSQA